MRRDLLSGVAIGTDKKPPPLGVVAHPLHGALGRVRRACPEGQVHLPEASYLPPRSPPRGSGHAYELCSRLSERAFFLEAKLLRLVANHIRKSRLRLSPAPLSVAIPSVWCSQEKLVLRSIASAHRSAHPGAHRSAPRGFLRPAPPAAPRLRRLGWRLSSRETQP